MFFLTQSPTWRANITVELANEKSGWDKSFFTAEFERVEIGELDALREMTNVQLLERVLVGWDKVYDPATRTPVLYTEDNKSALLKITPAVLELAKSFWEGQVKAKTKN